MIKKKEALTQEKSKLMDKELVEQKLFYKYQKFKDIFSKAASNILPPYRLYNYKIEIKLDKEDIFNYSPLRQQFTAELQAIKQYLINNLDKGFIKPS